MLGNSERDHTGSSSFPRPGWTERLHLLTKEWCMQNRLFNFGDIVVWAFHCSTFLIATFSNGTRSEANVRCLGAHTSLGVLWLEKLLTLPCLKALSQWPPQCRSCTSRLRSVEIGREKIPASTQCNTERQDCNIAYQNRGQGCCSNCPNFLAEKWIEKTLWVSNVSPAPS